MKNEILKRLKKLENKRGKEDKSKNLDILRKIHNCETCKNEGNNGCGTILFECLEATGNGYDGWFICQRYEKK